VSETPRPDPDANALPASVEQEADEAREWWQDPSMPWQHKPTRADIVCFTWLGIAAAYGVVISILRPGLLGSAPKVLASLGSWSGVVLTGAMAQGGDPWWPLVWVLATVGFLKFDWIYWWAGKLWGRSLIEIWSGKSERARRWNARAEQFARKYETLALIVNFLPIPLPRAVILAVLGEAGTSLTKLLTVSAIASFVTTGCYLAVGYWIGQPAVAVMDLYGRYLWYVSLAILVVVVWQSWRASAAKAKA
jgi:membrane protein DedA with SNARE-associated domain